jgi:hypothetical protein
MQLLFFKNESKNEHKYINININLNMTVPQPRYSKEEFSRRGTTIYETQLRSQIEEGNHGKIVAINIETGAFEVADTPMVAVDRLYEREPDAQPWVIRIGHSAVFRLGSRSLRKASLFTAAISAC